jgi:hypothetical protein
MDLRRYFLRALSYARTQKHCSSQDSFNKLLRNAYPLYTSNASVLSKLKTGSAVGNGVRDLLKEAIDALCAKWQISLQELPEVYDQEIVPNKSKLRLDSVPKLLTGRWLFVQMRSQRKNARSEFPEEGYRTAVLTYGKDNKKKRDITIVGESTGWSGHVQMLNNKLYHFADEYQRTDVVRESAFFITFPPFDGKEYAVQKGVVLGISRGRYEHQASPVYASRLLLRRLPSELCPAEMDSLVLRMQFCGYFGVNTRQKEHFSREARKQDIPKEAREFLSETFDLFDEEGKPPHSSGDRIFVNPI